MAINYFKNIPDGWQEKRLLEICQINPPRVREIKINGETRPLKDDDQVTFLAMEDVTKDAKINKRNIRQYEKVLKGFTPFVENDVLIAKITPCFENGKGAFATDLVNDVGFGSTEFHVIRKITGTSDSQFLYYITNSHEFRARGQANMQGSAGQRRVPTDFIKAYHLLVPPISEQSKIARILFTWDKAIEIVKKHIENSQQQKKALMQKLLTGEKRYPGFQHEWKKYTLSELANVIMGSSPKSTAYNEKSIGLPLIQGNADLTERKSKPRLYTSEITKECQQGDILISVRAPVGTVAKSMHHACIGRGIAAIKAKNKNSQNYLYQWFLWFETKWRKYSQGSTFDAVNSNVLKILQIDMPSDINEQKQIANTLTNADIEIEILEKRLGLLRKEKSSLMQLLLTGKQRVKLC